MLRIDYLANCPQHAQMLAEWIVREWGYLRPGLSVEQSRDEFLARAVTDRIPLAMVALHGAEVVGCINLKLDEDLTRPGLSPWVGALYVREDHRGEGIGGELLRKAVAAAQRLGVPRLHLSATDAEAFYLARGWQVLDRLHSQGEDISLMCLDLDPPGSC